MRTLLDFIAGPESGGRYDIAYGGTTLPGGMTVGQVLDWQRAHGAKTGSSAVGRYQFIRKTLGGLVDELGISPDTPFTPELQDRLATQLLRRRGLDKFQAGELAPGQFARNLSMEWAGLPSGPDGRSYYAGDSMGNKAGVGWDELMAAIQGGSVAPQVAPQAATQVTPQVTPQAQEQAMGPMGTHPMLEHLMGQPQQQTDINDVLMAMGSGILNAGQGNWFGSGLQAASQVLAREPEQLGVLETLQANEALWELEERRRNSAVARKQEQEQQAARDRVAGRLDETDPQTADLVRAGLVGKGDLVTPTPQDSWEVKTIGNELVRYNPATGEVQVMHQGQDAGGNATVGLSAQYRPNPDGEGFVEERFANDGTVVSRVVPQLPTNLEMKTLEAQEELARTKAGAKVEGKAAAEAKITAPKQIEQATDMIASVDRLLEMSEGMNRAVGLGSAIGSLPGTAAADYEAAYNQVRGKLFLQAMEQLRGTGTVTEIEGKKAEQAMSRLSLAQSVEDHRAALKELRDITERARERAMKAAGMDAPSSPAPAAESQADWNDLGEGWGFRVK